MNSKDAIRQDDLVDEVKCNPKLTFKDFAHMCMRMTIACQHQLYEPITRSPRIRKLDIRALKKHLKQAQAKLTRYKKLTSAEVRRKCFSEIRNKIEKIKRFNAEIDLLNIKRGYIKSGIDEWTSPSEEYAGFREIMLKNLRNCTVAEKIPECKIQELYDKLLYINTKEEKNNLISLAQFDVDYYKNLIEQITKQNERNNNWITSIEKSLIDHTTPVALVGGSPNGHVYVHDIRLHSDEPTHNLTESCEPEPPSNQCNESPAPVTQAVERCDSAAERCDSISHTCAPSRGISN